MNSEHVSPQEMFLRYVDPEHHHAEKTELSAQEQEDKLNQINAENKLIEMSNKGKLNLSLQINMLL